MLRKTIQRAGLRVLQGTGVFRMIGNSTWRNQRLLILCYHGIAQDDEHLWRPALYMHPDVLEQRLQLLDRGKYDVLPLGEALERLRGRSLPPRSVVLTFDDGGHDFYARAYPLLKKYDVPATVYLTTYYSQYQRPVFNLICSYMLWKRRGAILQEGKQIGLKGPMDLSSEESRFQIVRTLVLNAEADDLTGEQKDALAARLAELLGIDYQALVTRRILHIMNSREVAELTEAGVDFQLHTHRHRTPVDERLFRKEIEDNRRSLPLAGQNAKHFCYPSGVYRPEFLNWLRAENVTSATTCDTGLVSSKSDPLLLPRFVDTAARSSIEFESWLNGVGALLARKRKADMAVPAAAGRASRASQ